MLTADELPATLATDDEATDVEDSDDQTTAKLLVAMLERRLRAAEAVRLAGERLAAANAAAAANNAAVATDAVDLAEELQRRLHAAEAALAEAVEDKAVAAEAVELAEEQRRRLFPTKAGMLSPPPVCAHTAHTPGLENGLPMSAARRKCVVERVRKSIAATKARIEQDQARTAAAPQRTLSQLKTGA
ncbi:hypothetical protein H4R21_002056 [Coemansia helicoidea]|uniref:Uncharacterized protein n=1 Tax=Coemansia helicoidea TaxID=1286919 RepID=A0ACC1L969_9FUNG|nr:hypothetical protein H4R21_002056 [Coemansia helicoidea]